ncbi:ABC transporter permease [Actinokineospora auranticolor]|uniref:ABC-2 family transporter n=1 Tax=Actinokineospora auranticolor TaxID=155976 RepID=A0A2S6H1J2_9PSEU|nr:ABC transporter permease [Actinokineospora auranticolor]PPK71301.1 ABC-2 family transporter [Actinokineospora auranticolor]
MTTALDAPATAPSLRETTRSEWTKLRSVRSTWLLLLIAAVVAIGLSLLFTFAATTTFDTMTPEARAQFDAAGTTRVGVDLSLILFVVFGSLAASTEFSSGMVRLTLTVTPNRLRVVLAKAIVVALPCYLAGALFATVAFLGGQAIIRGADPTLALDLGSQNVVTSLLNWGSEAAAFALIALCLTLLLRSAAGAIAVSMGVIFGPLLIGGLLPLWVKQNVLAYLPASAAENLTNVRRDPTVATYLDPQLASWVLGAWMLAFLATAYLVLGKRDSG